MMQPSRLNSGPDRSAALPNIQVELVADSKMARLQATARLLNLPTEHPGISSFISCADAEGIDLSNIWTVAGEPAGPVCLAVLGAGRTAMLFVSGAEPPICQGRQPEYVPLVGGDDERSMAMRASLLRQVLHELSTTKPPTAGQQTPTLAQALVENDQIALRQSYMQAGFSVLAELGYFRRELPRRRSAEMHQWPAGVRLVSLAELPPRQGDDLLWETLEASYVDTLDCPGLSGVRTRSDVLEAHRSVGEYDPAWWFVLLKNERPVGCLLLSKCEAQQSIELVYIGIAKAARGLGFARGLLDFGIAFVAGRGYRSLACAVDLGNVPAVKLYTSHKFRQFASRTALICPLTSPPT